VLSLDGNRPWLAADDEVVPGPRRGVLN